MVVKKQNKKDLLLKLQTKLKSLLQRVTNKSPVDEDAAAVIYPPDEASAALGKQIASVFISTYGYSCHNNKLKAEWHDSGLTIIDLFSNVEKNVNGAVVSAFFSSLVHEVKSKFQDSDDESHENQSLSFHEDLNHFWISVILHIDHIDNHHDYTYKSKSMSNTSVAVKLNQKNMIVLKASIKGFVKFAFLVYEYSMTMSMSMQTKNGNHEKQVISISSSNKNQSQVVEKDHMHIARLYQKMIHTQSRQFLIRALVDVSIHNLTSNFISTEQIPNQHQRPSNIHLTFVSPVLSLVLLSSPLSSPTHREEATLFIGILMREVNCITTYNTTTPSSQQVMAKAKSNSFWKSTVSWFTNYLNVLNKVASSLLSSSSSFEHTFHYLVILHDFSCQLCDLISNLILKNVDMFTTLAHDQGQGNNNDNGHGHGNEEQNSMEKLLNLLLEKILPLYAIHEDSDGPSLHPLLIKIKNMLSLYYSYPKAQMIQTSSLAFYKTSVSTLMLVDEEMIELQLELLLYLLQGKRGDRDGVDINVNSTMMCYGIAFSIGHIFLSTPSWDYNHHANELIQVAETALDHRNYNDNALNINIHDEIESCRHIFDLFDFKSNNKKDIIKLMDHLSSSQRGEFSISSTSTTSQIEMMLLGLSLTVITAHYDEGDDDNDDEEKNYTLDVTKAHDVDENSYILDTTLMYLDNLLSDLPHLGRRSLPIFTVILQKFISAQMTDCVMKTLEFMCNSLARDASCAHEIWTLISTFTEPGLPNNVQCMVLRLYPLLCQTNKRLYGRICESLGMYVSHPNVELKIMAASTICDLAKADLIRDVTDVIGWLQSFLTDSESMIVYYAILSLHYLVVTDEMDYKVVLKVLNKNVIKLDGKVETFFELNDLVIEALVIFLGTGGSDIDEDEKQEEQTSVSASTEISVATLCRLAISEPFLAQSISNCSDSSRKFHILSEIHSSLSKYSAGCLGIDEEMIRNYKPDMNTRYEDLKLIVREGFEVYTSLGENLSGTGLKKLSTKLTMFEQQALVSSLWIQGSKVSTSSTRKKSTTRTTSKAKLVKVLPKFNEIYSRFKCNPSWSTASAAMSCFRDADISSHDDLCEVLLEELMDDLTETSSEPLFDALMIHNWVSGMSKLWEVDADMDIKELLQSLLENTEENSGIGYIALAAFALSLPSDMTNEIDISSNFLQSAQEERKFESDSHASIALSLITIKHIQCTSFGSVSKSVIFFESVLNRCVKSGNSCFEAFHGLAIIAQALSTSSSAMKRDDLLAETRHILSILVKGLADCLGSHTECIHKFAVAINEGKELDVNSLSEVTKSKGPIKVKNQRALISICLSLSLAIPAFLKCNQSYLNILHSVALKLPWGGKGLLLSSTYRLGRISGSFDESDERELKSLCLSALTDVKSELICDDAIFFLAEVAQDVGIEVFKTWSEKLLQNNENNFSRSSRVYAILATIKSVGTIPSLFGGDGLFSNNAQLRPSIAGDVESVIDVVNKLSEIADNEEEDCDARDAASIALGILSSMRHSSFDESKSLVNAQIPVSNHNSLVSSLISMPQAREGTITEFLVNNMTASTSEMSQSNRGIYNSLSCLQSLSLPSVFANFFDLVLRKDNIDKNDICELKSVCLESLISQLSIERRPAAERRDYVRVPSVVANLPPTSFFSQIGQNSVLFMGSVHIMIPQWITKTVEELVPALLITCSERCKTQRKNDCMVSLLESINTLFNSQASMTFKGQMSLSPATTRFLQTAIVDFYPSLSDMMQYLPNQEFNATCVQYFKCISQVPFEITEKIFSFQGSYHENFTRLKLVAFLHHQNYVGSTSKQLIRSCLWVAQQQPDSNQPDKYIRVIMELAIACASLATEEIKSLIESIFEILLVNGFTSHCLELLSVLAAIWSGSAGSERKIFSCTDGEILRKAFHLRLEEASSQLTATSRSLDCIDFIFNRAMQIFRTNEGASSKYLEYMEDIILCSSNQKAPDLHHALFVASVCDANVYD